MFYGRGDSTLFYTKYKREMVCDYSLLLFRIIVLIRPVLILIAEVSTLTALLETMTSKAVQFDTFFMCVLLNSISRLPISVHQAFELLDVALSIAPTLFLAGSERSVTTAFGNSDEVREEYRSIGSDNDSENGKREMVYYARAQAEHSLFERAQKEGVQLPWTLRLKLSPLERPDALRAGPSTIFNTDALIKAELLRLSLAMRQSIWSNNMISALSYYDTFLEKFVQISTELTMKAIQVKEADRLSPTLPTFLEKIQQATFVRILSALLERRDLKSAVTATTTTIDLLGSGSIQPKSITRLFATSCSTEFHRHLHISGQEDVKFIDWTLLSSVLRVAKTWGLGFMSSNATLDASKPSTTIVQIPIDLHRMRALRDVLSTPCVLDHLLVATLCALFPSSSRSSGHLPLPSDGFKEVVQTILALNTDVNYIRLMRRTNHYAKVMHLKDLPHHSASAETRVGWSWKENCECFTEICHEAQKQSLAIKARRRWKSEQRQRIVRNMTNNTQ